MMVKFFKWTTIKALLVSSIFIVSSCSGDDDEPDRNVPESNGIKITIDPSIKHQEMVGFGGALTWYGERVLTSSKTDEIAQLLFKDLGMDILRLKNWYYPDNYPNEKGTESMSDDNSKMLWDATNQLYNLAKEGNPNVTVLLSSWGPPAGLKSNGSTREGTLKKNDDAQFMYDEFAQYWEDALDHLPFNPEYLSIQNEPSYVNSGWTTSKWSATETANLPGYDVAFDKVFDKIKTRTNPPVMIGPESPNIDDYPAFAEALKNKDHLGMYAYHPYDINSSTSAAQVSQKLKAVKNYDNRPNLMTEFSDNNFSWFGTASFIQKTLTVANTSGYIYWKLSWQTPASGTDNALVSINAAGQYTITPFYYVLKHFAKHIDAGFYRIDVTSANSEILVSGYINPSEDQVTLVIINPLSKSVKIELDLNESITAIEAVQSVEGDYYKNMEGIAIGEPISLPVKSITTVILDI